MSEYKNLCDSCRRSGCGGYRQFDPMIGPTIGCPKYKPSLWSLDWFINWSILFGLIAVVLCAIHAIITW